MTDYKHGVKVGEKYINSQGLEIVVLDVDKWTIKWTAVGYEAILPGTWWTVEIFQANFQKTPGLDAQKQLPKRGQVWINKSLHFHADIVDIRTDGLVVFKLRNGDMAYDWSEAFMERFGLLLEIES